MSPTIDAVNPDFVGVVRGADLSTPPSGDDVRAIHDEPTYVEHGIVHYAMGNMPGAVPHTSTYALTNATLPFQLDVAVHGALGAARRDPSIAHGLNTVGGEYANPAVAEALGATAIDALTTG